MSRVLAYNLALREALLQAMEKDHRVICFGLGASDPKGIFGTTLGLAEQFGSERVFDMPISENAMTGIAIGASLNSTRPVMIHQRLDFTLHAIDQMVNNAAKWYYMFGGQDHVPITVRASIGRGWGQGPTHSQHFQALFAHIPGLKVVMPTTAADAKGLFLDAIFDDNPVLVIDHRWLHNLESAVPQIFYRIPIGRANRVCNGRDLTIVSYSLMTIEAMKALKWLEKYHISIDLIDLRTIKPIDWEMVLSSVKKTGAILALDTGPETGSIAGEIIARASMECFQELRIPPCRIGLPDLPCPTSFGLTRNFYRTARDIAASVGKMLNIDIDLPENLSSSDVLHDVPDPYFKGPF